MSSLAKQYHTQQEYLDLERKAEYKSEYINGEIYAMSGASKAHIRIMLNIAFQLDAQLRERPCEVYTSDMRVKVSPTGMYTYPDVVAVCGEANFEDTEVDTLTNPTVIVEILSPSTEAYDRGEKFAHYRKLQSLTDYVLVAQDKVRVEHFARQGERDEQWMLTAISDPGRTLHLASIDCTVALRDIYSRVDFSTDGVEATLLTC